MTAPLLTSLEQAGEGSRLLLVDLNAAPFTRTFFDALNGYATGGSGRCLETLAIWNARLAASTPVGGWEDVIGTGFFLLERLADFENRITTDEDSREFDGHIAPAIARFRSAVAKFAPPPPSVSIGSRPQEAVPTEGHETAVLWAVERWKAEVENRPLVNKNRRALDDTWRQVIRHFGGDPGLLLPLADHDTLIAADGCSSNEGADE